MVESPTKAREKARKKARLEANKNESGSAEGMAACLASFDDPEQQEELQKGGAAVEEPVNDLQKLQEELEQTKRKLKAFEDELGPAVDGRQSRERFEMIRTMVKNTLLQDFKQAEIPIKEMQQRASSECVAEFEKGVLPCDADKLEKLLYRLTFEPGLPDWAVSWVTNVYDRVKSLNDKGSAFERRAAEARHVRAREKQAQADLVLEKLYGVTDEVKAQVKALDTDAYNKVTRDDLPKNPEPFFELIIKTIHERRSGPSAAVVDKHDEVVDQEQVRFRSLTLTLTLTLILPLTLEPY
jgi:hypothetical protein